MFFLVTMKNPGRTPKYHEKELGACRMSPTCTDAEGAHHTFLAEAPNMEIIFAQALKEEMHITRIEEVYHIRKYEATDVSVRDDADQRVPSIPGTITQFHLNTLLGIRALPRGDRPSARGSVVGIDPAYFRKLGESTITGDDGSGGTSEVPGTRGGEQQAADRVPEYPTGEGDYRIGPDGDGVIRN